MRILLLLVLTVYPGFAQVKTVELKPIESYACHATVGGVTVAADTYGTDEKSFTAFNVKDLNTRGYFPVHVIIRNATTDYISVSARKIMLDKGGQGLYTVSAASVVDDVVTGGAFNKPRKTRDAQESMKAADSAMLDFVGKELVNRQLEPGAETHGFVFFFSSPPAKDFFAGAKLVVPLTNDATRKEIGPFSLPLAP